MHIYDRKQVQNTPKLLFLSLNAPKCPESTPENFYDWFIPFFSTICAIWSITLWFHPLFLSLGLAKAFWENRKSQGYVRVSLYKNKRLKKTEIHTKCIVELQTHCVDYLFHLLDQLCFFSVDSTKSSFYSLYLTGTYFKWLLPASFTQVNSNAEKTRLPFPHFQGWDFKLCRTDFSSSIHSHPTNNYTFNGYCLSSCCYIIGLTK